MPQFLLLLVVLTFLFNFGSAFYEPIVGLFVQLHRLRQGLLQPLQVAGARSNPRQGFDAQVSGLLQVVRIEASSSEPRRQRSSDVASTERRRRRRRDVLLPPLPEVFLQQKSFVRSYQVVNLFSIKASTKAVPLAVSRDQRCSCDIKLSEF